MDILKIIKKNKKLLIVLTVFLIIIFISFVFWTIFSFKKGEDIRQQKISEEKKGEEFNIEEEIQKIIQEENIEKVENIVLPTKETQKEKNFVFSRKNSSIKRISSEEIVDFSISPRGEGVVYITKADGNLIESDFKGNKKIKLNKKFIPKIKRAIMPKRFNFEAILFKEGVDAPIYYNFKTNTSKILPSNIREDIKWSPSGTKIIYFYDDFLKGGSNIAIAEPDNSKWKIITKTGKNTLKFFWPVEDLIVILEEGFGYTPGNLYILDLSKNTQKKVFSGIFGLNFKWSPNKNFFIYIESRDTPQKFSLWEVDNGIRTELEFYGLPSDCEWSKTAVKIFCFTQNKNLTNTGLIESSERILPENISFWELDLEKAKVREIAIPEKPFSPEKMLLSPNEDYLIFKNKLDGFLYSINL